MEIRSAYNQRSGPERRHRRPFVATLLLCSALLAGMACSPGITVTNNSGQSATVSVTPPHAGSVIKTLQPKQTTLVDVWEAGTFRAAVIPTKEWTDFVKTKRDLLESLLAIPGQSASEVAQLKKQLSDIATTIDSYDKAGGGGDVCTAVIASEPPSSGDEMMLYFTFGELYLEGGSVVVTQDSGGKAHVTCTVVSNPSHE